MSKRIKISDFAQDDKNFNLHTDVGMELLKKSIESVGVIESVTVSSDDKIISGNARQEKIIDVFGEDVEPIIVETDGKRPVVLKRTDIQSGTKQFYEAAILANTTAKKNISLDICLIQEVAVEMYNIEVEEIGIDSNEYEDWELPNELTATKKNEPPTMKITFSNLRQLKQFEVEIKKLIELKDFSDVIYSISQGEI